MFRVLSLSLVLSFLFTAVCGAQEVTVRAIDARTNRPVKRKVIRVYFADFPPYRARSGYLEGKTDSDGRATFKLPSPVPGQIKVFLEFKNWDQCSERIFDVPTVLRTGIVGGTCAAAKEANPFTARPGEVVVFAKYISIRDALKNWPG